MRVRGAVTSACSETVLLVRCAKALWGWQDSVHLFGTVAVADFCELTATVWYARTPV